MDWGIFIFIVFFLLFFKSCGVWVNFCDRPPDTTQKSNTNTHTSSKINPLVLPSSPPPPSPPVLHVTHTNYTTTASQQMEASVLATQLRPCLEELAADPDRDVRFYAHRAIKLCDELAPRH